MDIILLQSVELSYEVQEIMKTHGIVDVESAQAFLDRLHQQSDNQLLTTQQIDNALQTLSPFKTKSYSQTDQPNIPPMGVIIKEPDIDLLAKTKADEKPLKGKYSIEALLKKEIKK